MSTVRLVALSAAAVLLSALGLAQQTPLSPSTGKSASEPASRRKGYANVEALRPERFPHRIWAANDFEGKLPEYGLFGSFVTDNIPKYPGNVTALLGRAKDGFVGMNPVPGPFMGKVNYMYARYWIKGAQQARFQHYSLSRDDNWNILVKGLVEEKWSELTLNFTRDAKRNDGSAAAFDQTDRMDDLKTYYDYSQEKTGAIQMALDDVIFFAEDPALPPEKEPFPNRVLYVAGFDTGVESAASQQKFFPGKYELVSKPPAGAYWSALKAVAAEGENQSKVVLQMQPKPAGADMKLRFRYWLKGAEGMKVALHNATASADHVAEVEGLKSEKWETVYVPFAEPAGNGPKKPIAVGDKLDAMTWTVEGGADKATLYVDEVILFDAGKAAR